MRKVTKLDLKTKFMDEHRVIKNKTVSDFWQWAFSDLMQNTERGVLAEYIVAVLLGVDDKLRIPWLPYDLKLHDGSKVEVKAMAKLQAWYQKKLSHPRVIIKPTRAWNPETDIMEDKPNLHSDIYVICYFTAENHDTADLFDLRQWKFYVLLKREIQEYNKIRESISLSFLRKCGIKPVNAHEFRKHILQRIKS